jgi:hypothetical protein
LEDNPTEGLYDLDEPLCPAAGDCPGIVIQRVSISQRRKSQGDRQHYHCLVLPASRRKVERHDKQTFSTVRRLVCDTCGSSSVRRSQCFKEYLGILEISRVPPFGEPGVERSEELESRVVFALALP